MKDLDRNHLRVLYVLLAVAVAGSFIVSLQPYLVLVPLCYFTYLVWFVGRGTKRPELAWPVFLVSLFLSFVWIFAVTGVPQLAYALSWVADKMGLTFDATGSMFGWVLGIVATVPSLLIGRLVVREVDRPRFIKRWDGIGLGTWSTSSKVQAEIYTRAMRRVYLVLAVVSVLFLGGAVRSSSMLEYPPFLTLRQFYAGSLSGTISVLLLAYVVALASYFVFMFSKQKLWNTVGMTVLAAALVMGLGTIAEYSFQTRYVQKPLEKAEGVSLAESCAVLTSQETQRPLEDVRKEMDLRGEAPEGLTSNRCAYYLDYREGKARYSGYGTTVNNETGEVEAYYLTGEEEPWLGSMRTQGWPNVLLSWLVGIVLPITLIGAMLRKAYRG